MDRRRVLLVAAAFVAALGTMLVFLYVRGADARADARYDAVQVLRVVKPIAAGESVASAQAEGKFATSTISSQDRLAGSLNSLEPLSGQVALSAMYAGEQVIEAKFGELGSATELALPEGKVAISINLDDPARVAGFLDPGDDVAIFMNGNDADGSPWTRLLLRNVQVIGLGSTSATMSAAADPALEGAAPDTLSQALMTLAVSQDEAERIFFGTRNGDLSLALLDDASEVAKGDRVTAENLFD